jgi:hypothetical protein
VALRRDKALSKTILNCMFNIVYYESYVYKLELLGISVRQLHIEFSMITIQHEEVGNSCAGLQNHEPSMESLS